MTILLKSKVCGLAITTVITGLSACASLPPSQTRMQDDAGMQSSDQFSFVVIGDTPYNKDDEAMLAKAVPVIKKIKPPFVIHVGDTQSGGEVCSEATDARFEKLLDDIAPTPVFYTPGDNEWVDCDRQGQGDSNVRISELARLEHLRDKYFSRPPQGSDNMRFASMGMQPENASWVYNGVRFFSLNVTSTNNARAEVVGDPALHAENAAKLREAANIYWIKQQFRAATKNLRGKDLAAPDRAIVIAMQANMTNFGDGEKHLINKPCAPITAPPKWDQTCDGFMNLRRAIKDAAKGFSGPVLLIHGDTSSFTLNQDMLGSEAANLWRLDSAGDTWSDPKSGQSGGVRDVTLVEFDFSKAMPFSAVVVDGAVTRKVKRRMKKRMPSHLRGLS